MLNALSAFISEKERLITIEDAAELQLQQPHVGRMETRPPNIEGKGEIRQRELVKNALRMRPDRIILGECRGEEAFDMLQAMNTGHEGSMATIHANNPREAISRLEQMVGMAGLPMTVASIRGQIAAAIRLIVQLQRLSDGKRRVTSIAEITGMEGDIIQMQEIFKYVRTGTAADGTVQGHFLATGVRPRFLSRARAAGHQNSRQPISTPAAAVSPCRRFRPGLSDLSAGRRCRRRLFAEGVYLLFYNTASYRKNINRRLKLLDDQAGPRKRAGAVAARARADRGGDTGCRWSSLNQLMLQSGLTLGIGKLALIAGRAGAAAAFGVVMMFDGNLLHALLVGAVLRRRCCPIWCCKFLRGRRQKKFGAQFPDAHRHHRAQPARRPSGAGRDRHGGARNGRSGRHRIRHGRRRNHLRRRSRDRDAQPVSTASARTTCRCSSPRWRSRARPAAISAKFWKTCRASSASASRCAARSGRSRRKAAPRR